MTYCKYRISNVTLFLAGGYISGIYVIMKVLIILQIVSYFARLDHDTLVKLRAH